MSDESPTLMPKSRKTRKSIFEIFTAFFDLGGIVAFWGWNVVAAMVVLFLVFPFLFLAMVDFTFNGVIPFSIFLFTCALMVLPFVAMGFAYFKKIPIPALMFGIEIPLFTLLMMRMFLMREFTFASAFLVGSALLAIGLFAWGNWTPGKDTPPPALRRRVYKVFSPLVLVAGLFVGILACLYALPLVGMLFKMILEFFKFNWLNNLYLGEGAFFGLIIVAFVFATFLVFILFPVYVAIVYPGTWKRAWKSLTRSEAKRNFLIYSVGFAGVWIIIHGLSSHQPHAGFVTELAELPPAERVDVIQNEERVKKRLVHAYLNEYRYLGYEGRSNNLDVTYNQVFGSNFKHVPQAIQNTLLAPLLYKGDRNDKRTAGRLYQEIFDVSIQRAHKDAIAKALRTTYNRDDIEAGLMNIGARNVALTEQNITVDDRGDYAVITLEEVYKNLTGENQEIFYYFSLPADAALTGVWIGQTADRKEMDAYIVAPRGAAQEVYERSVRRQIDPALLEQVGPRQYRLRIFPIPVPWQNIGQNGREFEPMRLHMELTVPRTQTGFSLPTLLEKRNIDWTRRTKRTLNGKRLKRVRGWLPPHVSANRTGALSILNIDTVAGYSVLGEPQSDVVEREGLNLAVLVDTSYSMRDVKVEFSDTLTSLKTWAQTQGHSVDYILSYANGDASKRVISFETDNIKPFGQITADQQLRDFISLSEGASYDHIIIMTDQGTYGVTSPQGDLDLSAPLWFLHLGEPAFAYDDHVLDLIYSTGGGVADGFADFRRRIGLSGETSIVGTDYVWRVRSRDGDMDVKSPLSSLGAKQIITQAARGQKPTPEALDGLHEIAKRHSVVTPYSSMIVLVNERQKQALQEASEKDDRFERESKPGEEELQSPNQPLVSGVPEPHEWLLIFFSLIMLIYAWRNRDKWETA